MAVKQALRWRRGKALLMESCTSSDLMRWGRRWRRCLLTGGGFQQLGEALFQPAADDGTVAGIRGAADRE